MAQVSTRNPIQILPEGVIHKIAAGEVVERPASVIKELIENSLDAGATQIRISVEQGGIKSLVVEDNGHGIPPQEIPLALTRHATSKIRSAEDLFALGTLGFRGEALPSIAGVSRFQLESATTESAPVGYVWTSPQVKNAHLKECSRTIGTKITVEDLFYSTPARLKFLKRPETEWGHIHDLISSMALAHPEVEWSLTHNQKKALHCPIAKDSHQRVLDLFGKEFYEALYSVEREVSGIRLRGLLGHPNFSRGSNRFLFVFVNGRVVQDRLIQHAILSGYRGLLMTQQYPAVILFLEIDPQLVDVNVHPTKREVRFSNSQVIHHLISETLRRRLEESPWRSPEKPLPQAMSRPAFESRPNAEVDTDAVKERIQTTLQEYWGQQVQRQSIDDTQQVKIGTLAFSDLQLIGQFNTTYLICSQGESLVLIDQHAAHERIGFEKLKLQYANGKIPEQRLLQPLLFDLSEGEVPRLRPLLKTLEGFGFQLEEFGEKTFALKAFPTLLDGTDFIALFRELAGQGLEEGSFVPLENRVDHVLATMACHRQIRAGDRLKPEEMKELLRALEGTPRSYHCPHGRPVMVEVEGREIEKWFKRIL